MAGLGRKDFQAGAVLSAADVDGYLMDQSVMKFANTAAAGSAYGTAIAEGMNFYLSDTDEVVFHNGTSFVKQAAGENLIANGDFSKWSRGTSGFALGTTVNADRWQFYTDVSTNKAVTRQTFTPGAAPVAGYESAFFWRYAETVATSATSNVVYQRIEDVRTLAGQTVTVSFWAKSTNTSSTIQPKINQDFGTGGSSLVITSGSSITLTTSFVRYTQSIVVPSISGKTIGTDSFLNLNFNLSTNLIQTIDIWGVQLESGAVATPFKPAGGNKATDTVTAGSGGFDGVLVSTNSASNPSGSGTPAWAGYDVAGKNKIINGGFDFWQRGTSFTNPASDAYLADRWTCFTAGGARTVSQQTFTPGSAPVAGYEGQYYIRMNCTSAGTSVLKTKIEDVRTYAGQAVTLSFWAKADAARTINIQYYQQFGSGGSGAVNAVILTPTLTTSWVRYSATVTLPSIAGKTIGTGSYLQMDFDFGTAVQTIDIWGVQLEAGSVATPFSRAGGTLQGELAACQRYYVRFGGDSAYQTFAWGRASNSTSGQVAFYLPVTMRVAPFAIEYSTILVNDQATNSAITSFTINQNAKNVMDITFGASAGALTAYRAVQIQANGSTNAYVGFSAEL